MKYRRERGQLAIGIAFAFAGFLAMFGLIFNSSWLVREKMQLQQATDYATLRGAYVQKKNLDYIYEQNRKIKNAFDTAQGLLQMTNCYMLMIASNQVDAVTALSSSITGKSAADCSDACANFDAFVRARIIDGYNSTYTTLATKALTSLYQGNRIAAEESKKYFFSQKNLPFGLRNYLQKKLGGSFTSQMAKDFYDKGQLSDIVHLQYAPQDTQYDRLFNNKDEDKLFSYPKYSYPNQECIEAYCFCVPVPIGAFPMIAPTKAKIVRSGSENSTYLLQTEYLRPETGVEKTINLIMKDPTDEKRRSMTTSSGQKANLFRREGYPMVAWSMARAFGGIYPKAGNILGPADEGLGKPFSGIKLIGIADIEEQGTQLRGFPINGNIYGLENLHLEEVMH